MSITEIDALRSFYNSVKFYAQDENIKKGSRLRIIATLIDRTESVIDELKGQVD